MKDRFIRPTELAEILGVSRSTIWNLINEGKLPPRTKITNKTVGWWSSDIQKWKEDHWTAEAQQ